MKNATYSSQLHKKLSLISYILTQKEIATLF